MPQTINSNIVSLNAQRNLNTSQSSLTTSMERLSSGLRVNSSKDDAAGLAIADRMNAQIRGTNVAIRNANDGISLAQTAEGALATVTDALQRMRELAVQAQNGSNGTSDRANLDTEYQQLSAEITRIATQTKFNGTAIVGAGAGAQTFQVGANNGDTLTVTTAAVTTVTRRHHDGGERLDGARRDRRQARRHHHQPRHLRRGDEPLRLRDLEPADHGREPVGRARPDHGRRLRGRDGEPVARPDPAAGRHGDGGAGQPAAADGARAAQELILETPASRGRRRSSSAPATAEIVAPAPRPAATF